MLALHLTLRSYQQLYQQLQSLLPTTRLELLEREEEEASLRIGLSMLPTIALNSENLNKNVDDEADATKVQEAAESQDLQ